MSQIKSSRAGLTALVASAAIILIPASSQALVAFSDDFESAAVPAATCGTPFDCLDNNWLEFINQFDAAGGYAGGYVYNGGRAPAGGPQVSALVTGQGGAAQGTQVLVVYSDYDNAVFQTSGSVETNVFQEQFIAAADLGTTWTFSFDAKKGDIESPATALAFIKVFDPGFNLLAYPTLDTSNLSTEWNRYSIDLLIDDAWEGQRVQFGFLTNTSNYVPSGNYYDNVDFSVVPVPAAAWLFGSGLLALVGVARRRKNSGH